MFRCFEKRELTIFAGSLQFGSSSYSARTDGPAPRPNSFGALETDSRPSVAPALELRRVPLQLLELVSGVFERARSPRHRRGEPPRQRRRHHSGRRASPCSCDRRSQRTQSEGRQH